ncbi:MAG: glycosyltransferase [Verrucomicrobiales bacterium]|nr:glycosyltransferase [Verrucomicrobiales bacterium]
MKILHVNHLLDPEMGGGTAERTLQLNRFLRREGADCAMLTLDLGELDFSVEVLEGASIHKLKCVNERYFIHLGWPFTIRRIIENFDLVHIMGHWTMLNGLVALTCMVQKKPYVVCPAGALKPFGRSRRFKKFYDFIIGRNIVRRASGWVAITEAERADFVALGIPTDEIEVIPNGIDVAQYEALSPGEALSSDPVLELVGGAPYFLFLGRLNAIKGPDLLLEAFIQMADEFKDAQLVFVGPEGGLRSSLESMALEAGLEERVHFPGFLSGREKVSAIRNAKCLVIPSRSEAMSLVVLEAGACRTSVVFTDQCGLSDIAAAKAGLMVEVSVESIRRGLVQVLTDTEALNHSRGALEHLVKSQFSWTSQARLYLELYNRIVD